MLSDVLQRITRRLRSDTDPLHRAGQTRQDRALARRLRDTFEHHLEAADVQGLHFYVQRGTVTIYGSVRHRLDGELLTALAQQVPGVQNVVTHLQIVEEQLPAGPPNSSNEQNE